MLEKYGEINLRKLSRKTQETILNFFQIIVQDIFLENYGILRKLSKILNKWEIYRHFPGNLFSIIFGKYVEIEWRKIFGETSRKPRTFLLMFFRINLQKFSPNFEKNSRI